MAAAAGGQPQGRADRKDRGESQRAHGPIVGRNGGRFGHGPYPVVVSGFVDVAQCNLKGGDGGAGCVAFRRESHVPRGGPDGGDGGRGGDVWLRASRNVASLLAFRDHPHRKATSGTHGSGKKQHGVGGRDLVVDVPEGTVVFDNDGELLADLVRHGDQWLAARGGQGGRGNARFLSNARRAPSFAEQGEYGEERWLRLELKLLADAALVGFPNAGKSTLISALSAAKPKIADYPFTTLEPHLGVVRWRDHEFVLADMPGLIEGAAEGRGLGHQFLRHIERARVLVVLCDLAPVDGRSADEQARVLLDELRRYRPDLLDRPRVVIGSKVDVATVDFADSAFAHEYGGLAVSAVTRTGLDEAVAKIAMLVDEARAAEGEPEPFVVLRPAEQGYSVVREGTHEWRVQGRPAERAVALADITTPDALAYVQQKLRRMGVERALARAGAREGDVVRIGGIEMTYEEAL
jgi:GTP-binding protein